MVSRLPDGARGKGCCVRPRSSPPSWCSRHERATAYFGLLAVGEPKAGDTLLVSAAAGSVGHIVGHLAKIRGCRVIGVAGSDAKCDLLVNKLSFDAAVNRLAADFRERFKAATPDRINRRRLTRARAVFPGCS